MDRDDPAYRGQADYTPFLLDLYDPIVIGVLSRLFWRCPPEPFLDNYRRNITPRHLEVGPGTGYCIVHSGLPDGSSVTILDPNPNVLQHTSRKLTRFDVTAVEADALKPLPVDGPFESAGMNMVFHCLPAPLSLKGLAIQNIAAVLSPTGTLFGATILGRSADHSWLGRRVLAAFNRRGAFDNLDDSEAGLRQILEASFEEVDIKIVGSAAIFEAQRPREASPSQPG
ncbi:MAG TPA: methyltransferase domain-containing protein [Candidatus Limnocylindrales bacterium]|nr:methyltransferase domain-containing protein [Candidatus Limnocylindrales bacterium]